MKPAEVKVGASFRENWRATDQRLSFLISSAKPQSARTHSARLISL
jgi:hypothetical protein